MKAQEIFDTVARHLFKQGHRAMKIMTVGGDISKGQCAYRGDNGDMCAVGILIGDDLYDPEMEGSSIDAVVSLLNPAPLWMENNLPLLESLQAAHDCEISWKNSAIMRAVLWSVADEFGLETKALEGLKFAWDNGVASA